MVKPSREGAELIEKWQLENKTSSIEGVNGVKNICSLAKDLGSKDVQQFGSFGKASYGNLINFLEDNPGAIKAMLEWIGNNYQDELTELVSSNKESE